MVGGVGLVDEEDKESLKGVMMAAMKSQRGGGGGRRHYDCCLVFGFQSINNKSNVLRALPTLSLSLCLS